MIRIRAAGAEDVAAIARIHVETWRDTYAGLLPDHALIRMSAQRERVLWSWTVAAGESVLVAADSADGVVAFGSCGVTRRPELPFSGEVYTLYVQPDHQGQGVGRRLLNGLFQALRRQGHDSAVIWVLDANPSRYFYEAMGGRPVAERDEALWGVVMHEAAYGWDRLPAPCSPR